MHPMIAQMFSPTAPVLIISTLIVLLVPILIHHFVFRVQSSTTYPTFILLGPSGSGKTSLSLHLENSTSPRSIPTTTSQTPLPLLCTIPTSKTRSAQFRSNADPTMISGTTKFLTIDTPGHAKLRNIALAQLEEHNARAKGLVFVVDSAQNLLPAAEYLHDVLLFLQKKGGKFGSGSKTGKGVQFLIACNKNDLFTALPAGRIKGLLEREITKIRESRAKGLMSSGVKGADEMGGDEESEWLGEGGEGEFKLEMMEEVGVHVSVRGGSVEKDQSEVWWQWIGDCL